MKSVYERLYVPNNCVVAVVGGISKERLEKLLDEIGEAGVVQDSLIVPREESPYWQSCTYSIEQEGRLVHLAAALPCVSCRHPDFSHLLCCHRRWVEETVPDFLKVSGREKGWPIKYGAA